MKATAVAHPNIALIKYWGKGDPERNVPAVRSISITLDTLTTTTGVCFDPTLSEDTFTLNGEEHPERLARVTRCLDVLRSRVVDAPRASVESDNNFPTAAGLASSASGFAALVVAANTALDVRLSGAEVAEIARRASGSAARSVFGGFVEVGFVEGSDRAETFTRQILTADDWQLRVVIAVTAAGEKEIGSTEGMNRSARTSPYYGAWVDGSDVDLERARRAIEAKDFTALAEVSEYSCLKMHGVMMASQPGLLYWNGTTVDCLQRIRQLRRQGVPVFFTVDAVPQVKAVCLPEAAERMVRELGEIPGVVSVIDVGLGQGARIVGGHVGD
jgi:diphosphomevalonate decarboxylase